MISHFRLSKTHCQICVYSFFKVDEYFSLGRSLRSSKHIEVAARKSWDGESPGKFFDTPFLLNRIADSDFSEKSSCAKLENRVQIASDCAHDLRAASSLCPLSHPFIDFWLSLSTRRKSRHKFFLECSTSAQKSEFSLVILINRQK